MAGLPVEGLVVGGLRVQRVLELVVEGQGVRVLAGQCSVGVRSPWGVLVRTWWTQPVP